MISAVSACVRAGALVAATGGLAEAGLGTTAAQPQSIEASERVPNSRMAANVPELPPRRVALVNVNGRRDEGMKGDEGMTSRVIDGARQSPLR